MCIVVDDLYSYHIECLLEQEKRKYEMLISWNFLVEMPLDGGGGRGEGVGGHASIVVTGRYKRGQIVRPYKCYKIKTRQIKVS